MALLSKILFGTYEFPDVAEWDESFETRIAQATIPRRDGVRMEADQYLGPRTISLKGVQWANSEDTLRTQMDTMRVALQRAGEDKLWMFDDRYINAIKKSLSWGYPAGAKYHVAEWNAQMFCADPYYYASGASNVTYNNVSGSGGTFNLNVYGNAPAIPTITVNPDGTISGLTVSVTNIDSPLAFSYSYTVETGQDLIVNSNTYTCTNYGTSDLTNFSGDFIKLFPGNNVFTLEAPAACDFTFDFTCRWY